MLNCADRPFCCGGAHIPGNNRTTLKWIAQSRCAIPRDKMWRAINRLTVVAGFACGARRFRHERAVSRPATDAPLAFDRRRRGRQLRVRLSVHPLRAGGAGADLARPRVRFPSITSSVGCRGGVEFSGRCWSPATAGPACQWTAVRRLTTAVNEALMRLAGCPVRRKLAAKIQDRREPVNGERRE